MSEMVAPFNFEELLERLKFKTIDKSSLYWKELKEYYESINYLGNNSLSFDFENKDRFHAIGVMSKLISTANSTIKIFAGDFNGDICDEYKDVLESKIKQRDKDGNHKVKLDIVFENNPNPDSECFKMVKSYYKNIDYSNVNLYLLQEKYKKVILEKLNVINHFTVCDGIMYRYEVDTKNYQAHCNFDKSTTCVVFEHNFSKLIENSDKLN